MSAIWPQHYNAFRFIALNFFVINIIDVMTLFRKKNFDAFSYLVSTGYSDMIVLKETPSESMSSINETHILVPFMHGFPKQILGLVDILFNKAFIIIAPCLLIHSYLI